jgi:hypothetical protein
MSKLVKPVTFLAVILICFTTVAFSQAKSGGKLDMSERIFDFGLVPQESRVVHNFMLKNVGDAEVNITEIKSNCGCTTAPVDENKIAPGDSTVMEVTFKSGRRTGKQEKFVNVTTDMEPRGLFRIVIQAWVETPTQRTPPLTSEPRTIEYAPRDMKHRGKSEVTLKNNSDETLELEIAGYYEPLGHPELKGNSLKPGETAKLVYDFNVVDNNKLEYGAVTVNAKGEEIDLNYTVPITKVRVKK